MRNAEIRKGEVCETFSYRIFVNILELKACEKVEPIYKAQLLTYLKLSGVHLGLVLNFNVPVMRDGIVRVENELDE